MAASEILFGSLQEGIAPQQIALRLMLWSLPWALAGLVGLWRAQGPKQRAFWLMSGVWACINLAIALAGLLGAVSNPQPPSPAELSNLRQILIINAGLDGVYLAVALWLLSQKKPIQTGFGWAILIQGIFLLLFDLLHALQI